MLKKKENGLAKEGAGVSTTVQCSIGRVKGKRDEAQPEHEFAIAHAAGLGSDKLVRHR